MVIEERGRQTRRKAHEKEQLLSAATEEAIVKWILQLDNWCDGCVPRARSLWHALAGFADKPLSLGRSVRYHGVEHGREELKTLTKSLKIQLKELRLLLPGRLRLRLFLLGETRRHRGMVGPYRTSTPSLCLRPLSAILFGYSGEKILDCCDNP